MRQPVPLLARGTGLLIAAAVLLLLVLTSLALGNRNIAPPVVLDALTHYDPTNFDHSVVITQRVPRTLLALGVGAALGLGGTLMQALTRNPLADPGLLGVNAGAALAIVLTIAAFGWTSPASYAGVGIAGAAVAAFVVYRVSGSVSGQSDPVQLALAGTAVTALVEGGLIRAVLVLDYAAFDSFRSWDVGSLSGRTLESVAQVAPFVGAGLVMALALAGTLNVLSLGDQTATALGARVGTVRLVAFVAVTMLSGSATAAAGPVGFVGLVVPFAVRAFTGPDYRWILPYSALLAPILLLGADVAARIMLGDETELPVGLVTALVGAPVFIALARRRKLATL
ncbi:FecCD family ABC transporter permease [Streptoalloteichus hindustanus]|uniref:Iron complex transport system permease protein n=1 Tax=Streptoalloteichus hindustanus TaxID=2017 RepID=A0A1M5FKA7_STRHI|nr:iron chelate uptake ABC transporter family permease subunit [Streptoalloteichus hindustanus]SHF91960.1 iron complex transport system permease protein [Streptoalloteichus hindustanus]